MDRSFLLNPKVVAASRQFVCIRLSTYESESEAEYLKSIYVGRSGDLENTTFALLEPNGRKTLSRPGRGPHAFRSASQLADQMDTIAKDYPRSQSAKFQDPQPPVMDRVDLALNVAACENLPLLITCADTDEDLKQLNQALAAHVWNDDLAGQFVFATTRNQADLKPLNGSTKNSGILVVDPGPYGITGRVQHEFAGVDETLSAKLLQFVTGLPPKTKDRLEHRHYGLQLGLDWETVIPETDPRSIRAKARARGRD